MVNIPLLIRGDPLDVLRVPVSCTGDSPHGVTWWHSPGSSTCRRHLNAEIREDPDHPCSGRLNTHWVYEDFSKNISSLPSSRTSHTTIPLVMVTSSSAILCLDFSLYQRRDNCSFQEVSNDIDAGDVRGRKRVLYARVCSWRKWRSVNIVLYLEW